MLPTVKYIRGYHVPLLRAPRRTEHRCGPPAPNASPQPGHEQQAVHIKGHSAVFLQHSSNSIKVTEFKTDCRAVSEWRWPKGRSDPMHAGTLGCTQRWRRNEVWGWPPPWASWLPRLCCARGNGWRRGELGAGHVEPCTGSAAFAKLFHNKEFKILKLSFNPQLMSRVPIHPTLNQIHNYFHVLIIINTVLWLHLLFYKHFSHLWTVPKVKVLAAADRSTT